MRRSSFSAIALLGFAALVTPALSPIAAGQSTLSKRPVSRRTAPVPFTAEFKNTRVQTLANGTTITRETTQESEGRSLFVNTSTQQFGDHGPVTSAHIDDPVAGTRIDWNSTQKKVTIVRLPPEDQRHGCWRTEASHMTINYGPDRLRNAGAATEAAPKVSAPAAIQPPANSHPKPDLEDLGDAMILGVEAHGQRWTTTTPAGAIGNDQPLVSTSETWNAKGLHLVIRQITDDPQQGKDDLELVTLLRGEPDPALFQPPEGYEVVTEEMAPCKE